MIKQDSYTPEIGRLQNASEWLQRLNESNAQALTEQWIEWCRSDPLNLPAFEQMQRIWDAFPAERNQHSHVAQSASRREDRNRLMALAASVVLLVGAVAWLALRYREAQVLDTRIGERRSIALSDGSHIDLGPDSRVRTSFTLARRNVQLQSGQAFFTVAHSAFRQFVVQVNGMTVTSVGTSFDVRTGPNSTVVTVRSGKVNVASSATPNDSRRGFESVSARVGERVTFLKSAHRLSLVAVDPEMAGAWRRGTLQFMGEPLEEVVGEVNRYGAPQIVVAPGFQQTRFTGTVAPGNVRDWLKALEQIYAVEIVNQGANEILIRARAGDGSRN